MPFTQRSSLLKTVKLAAIFLVFAFVLEFFVFYASSRAYLQGLTEVNDANRLFAMTAQISDNLQTASEALEKSKTAAGTAELSTAFQLNQEQALLTLTNGAALKELYPKIKPFFAPLEESLQRFRGAGTTLFRSALNRKKNHLIASQFELEAKENLRALQIAVHAQNEASFGKIYRDRYRPLIVAGTIAVALCLLVFLFAMGLIQRLTQSIELLIRATDAVATGDFNYEAKVHRADELGRLTYEFNRMVAKARHAFQRTASLQNITASFSEALNPAQVSEVIVNQGLGAFGAAGVVLYDLGADGNTLELQRSQGFSSPLLEAWKTLPLDAILPLTDAVRRREPIWIVSSDDLRARYPAAYPDFSPALPALAALPLVVNGRPVGALGISFAQDMPFLEDDRRFLVAIANQAAQALQRARLYDQAEEGVRARDEFLSIASHELKTPITSLKMQLQMTQRMLDPAKNLFPPPERLAKFLNSSALQIGRLVNLVEDLLDVSKLQAGKLSLSLETVNLSEVVGEVIDRFAAEFAERKIAFEAQVEPEVFAHCDRFRMDQVFVNLISNALKYGEGKPIAVTLAPAGDRVRFAVRDSGLGVPPEKQAKIFERFERADPSRNISGLGLGLYIVKQIVDAQGGSIRIDSRPGAGSTFTVDLPQNEAPAAPA